MTTDDEWMQLDPEPTIRRIRRPAAVVVVLVLLGALVPYLWWVWARQAAEGLVVGSLSVTCQKGTVEDVGITDDGFVADDEQEWVDSAPRLYLTAGLDCLLAFEIQNIGPAPVTIRRLALPYLGTDGVGLVATNPVIGRDGFASRSLDTARLFGPAIDAVWEVGEVVAPGQTVEVTADLHLSPTACTDATMSMNGAVRADLEARGRRFLTNRDQPAAPGAVVLGGRLVTTGTDDTFCEG